LSGAKHQEPQPAVGFGSLQIIGITGAGIPVQPIFTKPPDAVRLESPRREIRMLSSEPVAALHVIGDEPFKDCAVVR